MSKQTMGEFLALLRRANGFTQQDVADKLNISNRTLSSWETDRTTPDILLLPAIADLYGVTVDELLRCERGATTNSDKKISDEALQSQRKHRLGKFSAKCLLLSGLGCFGAILLALAFVFMLYTSCPIWLFILLVVLASCDIVVCGIILFYNCYNAKITEGLVLNEDYTDEKKPYALALKHLSAKFFLLCALPLVLFAIAMIIASVIIQPTNFEILGVEFDVVSAYIATICTTGVLGIAFLIAYFVYANINFMRLANEAQAANYKYNKKLLGKTVGFGTIPIALCLILILFLELSLGYTRMINIFETDNYDDFKKYMQTLTVNDDTAELCGIEAGEYILTFPNNPELGQTYDLGNKGFKGRYIPNERYHLNVHYEYQCYEILLPYKNDYFTLGEYEVHWYYEDNSEPEANKYIVNLRATNWEVEYYVDYGIGIQESVDYVMRTNEENNYYAYQKWDYFDFSVFDVWTSICITFVTVITCATIYLVKRKKQRYEFY